MDAYDVAVIGGGPGGYAAALRAAELGARVALIEAEKLGGACVNHACIPTNILLDAAHTHLAARELAVMGVFAAGDAFNFARAAARKDALVARLSTGVAAALRMRRVTVIEGRASFRDPHLLDVLGGDPLWAETVIVATGTRWEPPAVPGFPPERVLTADAVQALSTPPRSALVLGDGPAATAFALEYATLLALAGTDVTFATPTTAVLPALDAALGAVVAEALEGAGIRVLAGATVTGADGDHAVVEAAGGTLRVPAECVIAADPRRPFFESLGLSAAGVEAGDHIPVDRACRTNVPHILAVGDVTGGPMLSNAATHMGEVAGTVAAGGEAVTRLDRLPHLLHTVPGVGWIGLTEQQAAKAGYAVTTGVVDLSFNARAVALGAREGLVKVVAERDLGEVLGVHVAGPEAAEVLAVAAAVMQAEVPLGDLAAMTFWHPSVAEGLAEAARRAL